MFVGRGTRWGNPYRVGEPWRGHPAAPSATEAVAMYRLWLDGRPDLRRAVEVELAGRDLMCWCPPGVPCHGDVLIQIANPQGLSSLT